MNSEMECAIVPHESRRNCRKPCRATYDEDATTATATTKKTTTTTTTIVHSVDNTATSCNY